MSRVEIPGAVDLSGFIRVIAAENPTYDLIKGSVVGNGFLEGGQFGYQAALGDQLEGAFLDSQSSWE